MLPDRLGYGLHVWGDEDMEDDQPRNNLKAFIAVSRGVAIALFDKRIEEWRITVHGNQRAI